jgi:hypothetical protein
MLHRLNACGHLLNVPRRAFEMPGPTGRTQRLGSAHPGKGKQQKSQTCPDSPREPGAERRSTERSRSVGSMSLREPERENAVGAERSHGGRWVAEPAPDSRPEPVCAYRTASRLDPDRARIASIFCRSRRRDQLALRRTWGTVGNGNDRSSGAMQHRCAANRGNRAAKRRSRKKPGAPVDSRPGCRWHERCPLGGHGPRALR